MDSQVGLCYVSINVRSHSIKFFAVPHLLIYFVNDGDSRWQGSRRTVIVSSWLHLYYRVLLGCGSCLGLVTSSCFCTVGETGCGAGAVQSKCHSLSSNPVVWKQPIHQTYTNWTNTCELIRLHLYRRRSSWRKRRLWQTTSSGSLVAARALHMHAVFKTNSTGSCVATVVFCSNGLLLTSFVMTAGSISWWRVQCPLACWARSLFNSGRDFVSFFRLDLA